MNTLWAAVIFSEVFALTLWHYQQIRKDPNVDSSGEYFPVYHKFMWVFFLILNVYLVTFYWTRFFYIHASKFKNFGEKLGNFMKIARELLEDVWKWNCYYQNILAGVHSYLPLSSGNANILPKSKQMVFICVHLTPVGCKVRYLGVSQALNAQVVHM